MDAPGPQAADRKAASARVRNTRPRDELGRPLPYGSRGVPPLPEDVPRTAAQTLELAQQLLDTGRPFQAHEVFEGAWKSGPATERALWQGLAQLAVGLTHRLRGNAIGAASVLHRGAQTLAGQESDSAHGVQLAALRSWAEAGANTTMPRLTGEQDHC